MPILVSSWLPCRWSSSAGLARLAFLAIGLTAAVSLGAGRATVVTTSELKVGARPLIVVDSDGGGVQLSAGAGGTVRVEAERQADSEEQARKLEVVTRLEGNTVHIEFKQAHHREHASVAFRITAPADARLRIGTGGGSVEARGFSGGIEVETGGGGVQVADAQGSIKLRSGGGSIDVRHVSGTVEVETGGGSVNVDGALSGKNRVETGGGSIHVAIPGASKLSVDASTGGGSANNEFGLGGERHPGHFRGTIGDGSGGSLELRTGGGSIYLGKQG